MRKDIENKIETGFSLLYVKDDYTEEEFRRGEPIASLFADITIGKDGLKEMRKTVDECDFKNMKTKVELSKGKCHVCGEDYTDVVKLSKRTSTKIHKACMSCFSDLTKQAIKLIEKREDSILMSSESGLVIFEADDEVKIRDEITGDEMETKAMGILLQGTTFSSLVNENSLKATKVSMKNLGIFSRNLREHSENDNPGTLFRKKCDLCNQKTEYQVSDDSKITISICRKCSKEISEEISNFIENNKLYFSSHSI